MTTEREGCDAVSVGNKIYTFGGRDGTCLSSADVYDVTTQEWTQLPDMKKERSDCAATAVGNRIYIVGGEDGIPHSSCEVFDTSTNNWLSLIPDMKEKREYCAATAVGNRIYIVGGGGDTPHSSCEVFDTSTNTWLSIMPDMNEKRSICQAVTIGPKIYVMGGEYDSTTHSSVEVFEMSMHSLYPTEDNYITVRGGFCSPKSLENLCIDQICRSLPDLDGDIPPGTPQCIINAILQSLMSHGVLNATILRPFRRYEFDQLPLF